MENQILFDIRSVIDSGLVAEIFSQNSPVSAENFNLETAVINNPIEEGLLSSQDSHLCTVNVGEALLDHINYPLTIENQNAIVKVEVHLHRSNSCDDEDLEKYKEFNLPEEAERTHSPYLPSDGVHVLSSVATQHNNCSVPTSSVFSAEGTVNQNVRMIPVFRSFIAPVAGENKCICYDQFEGTQSSTMQLQNLTDCPNESSSDIYGLPQTSASVYDEIVICQLEGGTQILCINSCDTQELKPVQLIPDYHDQHNYRQSDVDNSVTAVLGQFLPVPGELFLNKQEFENRPLQPVANTATLHLESDLHAVNVTSEGLPFGSEVTKSKKPCNCTKSQCLKLYCDCFANGDFCNNCNCNNCYNNQLNETERFKAIK
ncbi:tesmin-like, partial [Antrostomus carolinensis]|uniref:tesmin-like n=1 Tax=Antrostomus carolinensis TaxID=279965 RepID=UPI0010A98F0E